MTIEFKKFLQSAKVLNPTNNFMEKELPLEVRIDPLTEDMGILRESHQPRLERLDSSSLITKSLERNCPFCSENINKATPKFVSDFCPEGRIKVGGATVLPNLAPYGPYSAVVVMDSKHFIALLDFTLETLLDAFTAGQTYLKRVYEYDSKARYCNIIWNYMPPANSSQLHPHLQVFVNHFPMAYHQKLLDASRQYYEKNGTNYWSDFIAEEKRLHERYIATVGNTVWLTSFIPRAIKLDILAVFQGTESILSITQKDMESFCHALIKIFKYLDDQNFYSFNLCLYSGTAGEHSFWTQARIIQRGTIPPLDISDVGNMHLLLDTRPAVRYPETVCQELRPYFS